MLENLADLLTSEHFSFVYGPPNLISFWFKARLDPFNSALGPLCSGCQQAELSPGLPRKRYATHLHGLHAPAIKPGFHFCQQHQEFPSSHPSKYYPGPILLNSSVQNGNWCFQHSNIFVYECYSLICCKGDSCNQMMTGVTSLILDGWATTWDLEAMMESQLLGEAFSFNIFSQIKIPLCSEPVGKCKWQSSKCTKFKLY